VIPLDPYQKVEVDRLPWDEHLTGCQMQQVTIPFLLLQGEADMITDPEISKELYKSAKSPDKEIKLYPGMWHSLLLGESDEDVNLVFNDIFQWLDKRSSAGSIQGGGSPSLHEDVSPVVTDSSGAAAKHENISFQA